ncbi:hypothetical protein I79_003803 [Cricetulus griseus]|uniref:Uncharacterized protein n=1 Tax=Cricetulus griseus TaxID=10029 RepID=G3H0Y3_CRIGR|nr:hypothetical protein I79_003803 [Cricetulus griseus]
MHNDQGIEQDVIASFNPMEQCRRLTHKLVSSLILAISNSSFPLLTPSLTFQSV